METKSKNSNSTFENFIKQNLNYAVFEVLDKKMDVSKKMVTTYLRHPEKMGAKQILFFAELMNKTTDEIISVIKK